MRERDHWLLSAARIAYSKMPLGLKERISGWRMLRIQNEYAELPLGHAFDHIYKSEAWGKSVDKPNSGTGSSGRFVEDYTELMRQLISRYRISSIADLGCGNFTVGKRISGLVSQYCGVDVAESVVKFNTASYSGSGIRFMRADLTHDHLPWADAAIVRQVLQHLSNLQIEAALNNILKTYSLVIVTEHVYVGNGARSNLDISHGPGTRVPLRSGVFIDQPPFSIPAIPVSDLALDNASVMRTWVIEGPSRLAATQPV